MSAERPATAQTLLILGASGDLVSRYLLPGLGALLASGRGAGLEVAGSARTAWDDERWRDVLRGAFASGENRGAAIEGVVRRSRYSQADATSEEDLRRLLAACTGRVLVYFALPPPATAKACEALARIGLPEDTWLVMEKPFGTDAGSARALNDLAARLVPEERVFRVDHFLALASVRNIIGLRSANRVLEPLLTAEHVQSVDVVFDERLALEGRAGFYDGAGALIDVTQSHLLQVLATLAMDPPSTLDARDLHAARERVLRATRVWADDPVRSSRRARYTAGVLEDGRRVPSYVDEDGVDAARETETFADVVLAVDTRRWAGVPFRLRTGKALSPQVTEVNVTFKAPPAAPRGLTGPVRPNRLRFGLDRSWLRLELNASGAGSPSAIDPVTLEATLPAGELPEYGEVLRAVIEGDRTLSVSAEAAVESWRIIEPVVAAWQNGELPLLDYAAGSAGPTGWPPGGLPGA